MDHLNELSWPAKAFVAIAGILVFVVVGGALLTYSILANGFVISVLWGWFVVPVFGLPVLGVAQSIGLGVLVALVCPQPAQRKKVEGEKPDGSALISALLMPWMALLIGWIVTLFL